MPSYGRILLNKKRKKIIEKWKNMGKIGKFIKLKKKYFYILININYFINIFIKYLL